MALNEPQTWTILGILAATLLGAVTALAGLAFRMSDGVRGDFRGLGSELRTEIRTLGSELRTEIGTLGSELRAEIGGLRTEVNGLRHRIDDLDRDVKAIAKHVFRDDPRV
jgi:hypothetical protein